METIPLAIVTILGFLHILSLEVTQSCEPTQKLEIGKAGVIQCSFDSDIYGILWYKSRDTVTDIPTIKYAEKKKSGQGFESGEYDIHTDGSLIIKNVSLEHEHTFTAVMFPSKSEDPIDYFVDVITIITPHPDFPVIGQCGYKHRICFKEIPPMSFITCNVQKSRPVVHLSLAKRTNSSDLNIGNMITSFIKTNVTYSTTASMDSASLNSSLLALLVCKAYTIPELLRYTESVMLVQLGSIMYSSLNTTNVYVEIYGTAELNCSGYSKTYYVWKRTVHNITEEVAWEITIGEKYRYVASEEFQINENGTLKLQLAMKHHEGLYACIYNEGKTDKVVVYNISTYVLPDPITPVVDGCANDQYCVLVGQQDGILTCSVYGIRPEVNLQWRTFKSEESDMIYFYEEKLKITKYDETFDVTLISKYRLKIMDHRITLKCIILGPLIGIFQDVTLFDLLVSMDPDPLTEESSSDRSRNPTETQPNETKAYVTFIIVIVVVFLFIVVFISVILARVLRHRCKDEKTHDQHEEMQPMAKENRNDEDLSYPFYSDKKQTFVKQLRTKYQLIYNSVCPIPFLPEKRRAVEDIFVEGGIEFESISSNPGRRKIWIQFKSYHDILSSNHLTSFLRIIEGDPGIGKSTLALKFACDWCERSVKSPLKDVEILIYLKLRQLGNIASIYKAIRLLLLPIDSSLSENDIENVIQASSSVILILDGYDELNCPNSENDVQHILERNMFQHFQVLLTTRTRVFPKNLPPTFDIIRLTGFDEKSRNAYLLQVVKGNKNAADEIKQSLQNNPILVDLCQVPLFFSMYAHIEHDFKANLTFSSVTYYFKYIISCFHGHFRNKQKHINDFDTMEFEKEHSRLSKVAFDALTGTKTKYFWIKEELCTEVGKDFYTHYVRVGILVEEEEVCVNDEPGMLAPVYKKTRVRFFHMLFCEWYAAHFLSSYAQKASHIELRNTLQSVNPFTFQYIYRFACGLNENRMDSIIKYLQSLKSGDKFATLCLLEQTRDVREIAETVTDLCSGTVLISNDSSNLAQRSILQLINIATKVKIPVETVHLENCFTSADLQKECILLNNGLHVFKLSFVKELKITEMGREMTCEETINLLKFSLICEGMHQLTFECTLLPESFNDSILIDQLISKKINVLWIPTSTWYCLTAYGQWETQYEGSTLTSEAYREEVDNFRDEWSFLDNEQNA